MRTVLRRLGVYEVERHACLFARIRLRREIPYDLLLYFSFVAVLVFSTYSAFVQISERIQDKSDSFTQSRLMFFKMEEIETSVMTSLLFCIGLVAFVRRLYLSRS